MSSALGVRRVRVPFRVPFETAAGAWTARESLLVELRSDDGSRGIGEAPIDGSLTTAALTQWIQALIDGSGDGVPTDVGNAFSAGLGGALLDLAPPPEPVFSAVRAGVGANATIPAGTVDETAAATSTAVALGFRTLKVKAGTRERTSELADRLRVMRELAGDDAELRLDVNGTWELDDAVERLRALEPYRLQYVEQPLPVGARGGAAQLRGRVATRIAADEAVTSPEAAVELVEQGAVDVLVVKPARVGGPGAVAAIAGVAAEHGVPVVLSSLFETGIGLAAAIALAATLPDVPGWPAADRDHGLATAEVLAHDLLFAPLIVEGGRIRAPFGPGSGGLGITLDEAAIERYAVDDAG